MINFVNKFHLFLRIKLQFRLTRQGHENRLYIILVLLFRRSDLYPFFSLSQIKVISARYETVKI